MPNVVVIEEQNCALAIEISRLRRRQRRVLEAVQEEEHPEAHEEAGDEEVDKTGGVDSFILAFVNVAIVALHGAIIGDVEYHVGHKDYQEILGYAGISLDNEEQGHDDVHNYDYRTHDKFFKPGWLEHLVIASLSLVVHIDPGLFK